MLNPCRLRAITPPLADTRGSVRFAIRVAAGNLKATWLPEDGRAEQSDLILAEVERLMRLFNNVLEMARIDAGAVAAEERWSYPSEIVSAARDQVEQSLKQHRVSLEIEQDTAVRLDARLAASAMAHLLENAAQYAPRDTSIDVSSEITGGDLLLRVRDHGPGIADGDLAHVFDRFFRGRLAAQTRASGTGMGLWIAKGLVSAVGGRIWVENCADGGARFTLALPLAASTAREEPAS